MAKPRPITTMTDDTKTMKAEVQAMVKEADESRLQLQQAVDRLAAQIDQCAASQAALRQSVDELKTPLRTGRTVNTIWQDE